MLSYLQKIESMGFLSHLMKLRTLATYLLPLNLVNISLVAIFSLGLTKEMVILESAEE